jgi:HlyD family secretion protein
MEQLSSPEQLEQMIRVTNRRGWIMLSGLMASLFTALLWSVFGTVPTRISGECMIHKEAGVNTIVSKGAGVITMLAPIKPGDHISVGQLIATVAQPELEEQLDEALRKLKLIDVELGVETQAIQQSLDLKRAYQATKKKEIEVGRKAAVEMALYTESTLPEKEALRRDGIITSSQLQEAKQRLYEAKQKIESYDTELKQLAHDEQAAQAEATTKLSSIRQRREAANGEVQQVKETLTVNSEVQSQFVGKVIEVKVFEGDMISTMTPLVDVEEPDTQTEVTLYLPPHSVVKDVVNGMPVQVSPSNAPREEFGFIQGKVQSISPFPATREGMLSILHYPQMVDSLSREGPPYALQIALEPDDHSENGFKWSSSAGNKVRVTPGTLCTGMVKVRDRPPITLLMPWLRQLFGIV